MTERKVLNKYYPPDFDPSKLPRVRRERNAVFEIRIMAPFNMRCNNCGEYIYKGKKFNSRKEDVPNERYLDLYIYRFYIKCPRCVSEIAFKTDPENADYKLEAGATRNFEALRTAEILAKKEEEKMKEEEDNNPMKVLENRTKASQKEMENLEVLEEIKQQNSRHAKMDHEDIINLHQAYGEQLKKLQDEEDEKLIQSLFKKKEPIIKRLSDNDDQEEISISKKLKLGNSPSDVLLSNTEIKKPEKATLLSNRKNISSFIKRKDPKAEKKPVKLTVKKEDGEDSKKIDTIELKNESKAPVPGCLSLLSGYCNTSSDSE
ncbi:DgyrCDS467 [Dimorphilus gyrociliatus]|uniref:Splicing factor YJU2 n=1 Tax=Dimorphilus gyrociliatus TaxID=2664684 RepID=A0A7I8V7G2_9ANNE|nr:DgyrCDS467 [Dimorphilus gyrociliatus]